MIPKDLQREPPVPVLCLADDLTGVAEVASLAADAGIHGPVLLDPVSFAPADLAGGVCFVNLGCRAMTGAQAGERVRSAVHQAIGRHPGLMVYLKVDSAGRGPIGFMLRGLIENFDTGAVPLMLANPQTARSTVDGVHYVGDQPLAESPFRDDPLHPAKESCLPELLAPGLGHPIGVWSGFDPIPGSGVHVLDARTQADIQSAARLWGAARVAAGSAAFLLEMLRQRYGSDRTSQGNRQTITLASTLVVLGTRHPNREPLRREFLDAGVDCWDVSAGDREGLRLPLLLEHRGTADSPAEVERRLAETAEQAERRLKPSAIAIIGGETARAVLARLGLRRAEALTRRSAMADLSALIGEPGRRIRLLLMPGSYSTGGQLLELFDMVSSAAVESRGG